MGEGSKGCCLLWKNLVNCITMPDKKQISQKLTPEPKVSFTNDQERLRRDIYRPDIEKLHLFTQMLRVNALFKKAKITHK